jgi:hypothetical protein
MLAHRAAPNGEMLSAACASEGRLKYSAILSGVVRFAPFGGLKSDMSRGPRSSDAVEKVTAENL